MRALSRDRGPDVGPDVTDVAYIVFITKILGRVNFALINPPFCGDNFFTDTR